MIKITYLDFENILGFKLSETLKKTITDFDLTYRELSKNERDNYFLHVFEVLTSDITKSGEHRINEWETGWAENLNSFKLTNNPEKLTPKYHGKNRIVRWNGDVVMPITDNFDYKIHICFVDAILEKYLKNIENVFEFGCGPSYHLTRLYNKNKNLNLTGLDWATSSQKIISEINIFLNSSITGINFNFFKPNFDINIPKNSAIYTVAALEQVGENFKDYVDFLINKSPDICIHMEPIDELLDKDNLIDNLSIKYFRKRNYLSKFLPYLENLEKLGKIEIIKKQRIFSGSYFIEGHSLIVWRIKK
jgi:hypothetical protein